MRLFFSYSVMANLVFFALSGTACATPLSIEQDQADTLKSLEAIASKIDDAPALLYLTPAQIDAASPEYQKKTAENRAALGKSTAIVSQRQLYELKLRQATINQLKAKIEQQNSALQELRKEANVTVNHDEVVDNLKNALNDSENTILQLQNKIGELHTAQKALDGEGDILKNALQASRNQNDLLQAEIKTLVSLAEQKTKDLVAMKKQNRNIILPESEIAHRDYAIGVSFGRSIIALLAERENQGITANKQLVIAGTEDILLDQLKLPPEKIAKVLNDTEVAIRDHEKQVESQIETSGARYIKQFMKQEGAKKAPMGFYYRLDSPGQGDIVGTDTVTVVVKESLTDGRVIKDMDTSGMAMSNLLDSYPPLFKAAILQMKNHGAMTVVVPPELAYGDKGLPPSVLPGSTMVYNIRILDVLPSKGK